MVPGHDVLFAPGALLMIRAETAVGAQPRLPEAESPMIVQGHNAFPRSSLRGRDKIGPQSHRIVKMHYLNIVGRNHRSQTARSCWPVKIKVGIQGPQGQTIDRKPLVDVEAEGAGGRFWRRLRSCQHHDFVPTSRQRRRLPKSNNLGPAYGMRRKQIANHQNSMRHILRRIRRLREAAQQ